MVLSILFDEVLRLLVPVLLIYIPVRIIYLKKHNRKIKSIKELINLAFVIYITAVAAILVIPRFEIYLISVNPPKFDFNIAYVFADAEERTVNLVPLASIKQQITDYINGVGDTHPFTNLIANLCLMMPMPVFIKLINKRINGFYCLVITLAVIIFCEASQYFRAGRACDIDDVILNFFGAIIGMILFYAFKSIYTKKVNYTYV